MKAENSMSKRLKIELKRLQRLREQIAELTMDACVRLQLPKDKTPEQLVKLLRRFHRIGRHECYYNGRREPTYHGELYEFYRQIVDKWTIGDVSELIKTMQQYMKLTKEKAIAKILVDTAYTYVLLYEYFMGIPNCFEKFVDRQGRPVSIPKMMVLYSGETERETRGRDNGDVTR